MVILIYITKSASWKAPNGGAIPRNWCITHSRRGKALYALYLHNQKCLLEGAFEPGRYVEKNFTFANWPFACSGGADLPIPNTHVTRNLVCLTLEHNLISASPVPPEVFTNH